MPNGNRIYVWDSFIRVFHWAVAIAFAVAYLTEDEVLTVHVWAGYTIGALIVLRVVWGVVGPHYTRFNDFVCRPSSVLAYIRDLLLFRAKRYIGHSPGGGAMVIALLISLTLTVGSGLVLYGAEKQAGPLAPFFLSTAGRVEPGLPPLSVRTDESGDIRRRDGRRRDPFVTAAKEVHEVFANLTLVLVLLHIGAVVLASFVHRENLIRAMVTGYKRP
jgi:cytochrome b